MAKKQKHIEKILKKMFQVSGNRERYFETDFSDENYRYKTLWTFKLLQKYCNWLKDYLTNHKEARKELMGLNCKKSNIENWIKKFILKYGFHIRGTENVC